MADVEKPVDAVEKEVPAVEKEGENAIDDEIQELEAEINEMAENTDAIKDAAAEIDAAEGATKDSEDVDKRSCYVGNVDYGATPEELQEHFKSCGGINRITIMVDRYTCCPKGYAYMEFADEAAVQNATLLNDSLFRGRQLKVVPKRTNVPGHGKDKGGKKGKGKKGKGKAPYGGYAGYAPMWGKGKKGKGKKADPYAGWW